MWWISNNVRLESQPLSCWELATFDLKNFILSPAQCRHKKNLEFCLKKSTLAKFIESMLEPSEPWFEPEPEPRAWTKLDCGQSTCIRQTLCSNDFPRCLESRRISFQVLEDINNGSKLQANITTGCMNTLLRHVDTKHDSSAHRTLPKRLNSILVQGLVQILETTLEWSDFLAPVPSILHANWPLKERN